MPPRPFLLFPTPAAVDPARRGGGGGRVVTPTPAQQRARLDAKFRHIADSVSSIQPTTQGMEPEQVIVLETVGDDISKLADAATHIPGLEWLAELDLEDYAGDAEFHDADKPETPLPHRIYALMTNQRAMTELLSLWDAWNAAPTERARRGFGPFKELFIHLSDVRRWGAKDRIVQTQIVEDWRFTLSHRQDQPARFEAELWFRSRASDRTAAYLHLLQLVQAQGGRALAQAAIAPILYHGVLLEMPAQSVLNTLQRIDAGEFTDLLNCEGVMFFRPLGQARFASPPGDMTRFESVVRPEAPPPQGNPRVALLDGMPLARHLQLNERLILDDPDDFGSRYEASQQSHGTAMSSLIVQGDLQEAVTPLRSPLYVRPILVPEVLFNGESHEVTPPEVLLVDLLHRAIHRIATELESTKHSVHVINLSIGDAYKPFIREMSPLARLLDWLAWEHQVLILVSAGNQSQPICLHCSGEEFARLPDEDALRTVLQAIDGDQASRRHFSPAEAVNVVTVGAVHADSSALRPNDRRIDLFRGQRLPSPVATVSRGFRRSVKPEILLPGGRVLFTPPLAPRDGNWEFHPSISFHPPGHLVAAPGARAMELDGQVYGRGSSNATALASRTAVQVIDRLETVLREYPNVELSRGELVCLTKALLVHGAAWGDAAQTLEALLATPDADWRQRQGICAKFLGFGELDPDRCLFCSDQRVTLLGWGFLTDGEAHAYQLPMPPSLSAKKVERRLTVSLAWLSPINPQHRNYRKAGMWLSVDGEKLGVSRGNLDQKTAQRGTAFHQVLIGEKARALPEQLEIKVNCVEDAERLTERVPYGLAVTLEVAEGVSIPIYTEVETRIRPRVSITPQPTSGS